MKSSPLSVEETRKLRALFDEANQRIVLFRERLLSGRLLFIFAGLLSWVLLAYNRGPDGLSFASKVCGGAIVALIVFVASALVSSYRQAFNQVVLQRLLSEFFPGFISDMDSSIPQEVYSQCRLYPNKVSAYSGSGYARGRVGLAEIEFSRLSTEYRAPLADADEMVSIFQGLFIHAEVRWEIPCRIEIFGAPPARGLWEMLTSWVSSSGNRTRVQVSNPRFEKEFVVYADDSEEARRFLTPRVMEALLTIKRGSEAIPNFSFEDGRVFIALPDCEESGSSEISVVSPSFEDFVRFYKLVKGVVSILQELDTSLGGIEDSRV